MYIVGYTIDSELLKKALNKFFNNQQYDADCLNVKAEGVQPITFKRRNSECKIFQAITIDCLIKIDKEFNEYTYEIGRWAVISLGNLEDFLKKYGELLD